MRPEREAPVGAAAELLAPLTARSVLLSVLLGTHPPRLPVRTLVRSAELFGISEGTSRVALSRLASEGDVVGEDGVYELSPRLAERQRRQDRDIRPSTRPWRGVWELAVAVPGVGPPAGRTALAAELARLRLAEMRPGVWGRPDNLDRDWPTRLTTGVWRFAARAADLGGVGPAELARRMWDLDGWAAAAEGLLAALEGGADPAERFVAAAAAVRHLAADPLLPPSMLPRRWPGERLRRSYDRYREDLGRLLGVARES